MSVPTEGDPQPAIPHGEPPATPPPVPMPRTVLCPYCGHVSMSVERCPNCGGRYDPLSRQATQNSMGPWFIRDEANPMRPGCSYDVIRRMVERGTITLDTVLRGPSTRQFWTLARRVPGVSHLLGVCHNCQADAGAADFACRSCGAAFAVDQDRQHMGLGPVRLLPGQASPEQVAASTGAGFIARPVSSPPPSAPSASPAAPADRPAVAQAAAGPDPQLVLGAMQRRLRSSQRWMVLFVVISVASLATLVGLVAVPVLVGELPGDGAASKPAAAAEPVKEPVVAAEPRPPVVSPEPVAPEPEATAQDPTAPADPVQTAASLVAEELAGIRELIDAGDRVSLTNALARLARFDPEGVPGAAEDAEQLRAAAQSALRRLDLPALP